jgi:hypothetical protein
VETRWSPSGERKPCALLSGDTLSLNDDGSGEREGMRLVNLTTHLVISSMHACDLVNSKKTSSTCEG